MKHLVSFFVALSLLFLLFSCSGTHINKKYKYANQYLLDSMQVPKPDFRTTNLEVRIWTFDWLTGNDTLKILRKKKDNSWIYEKRVFLLYNGDHYHFDTLKTIMSLPKDWDAKWNLIQKQKLLCIKNEKKLKRELIGKTKELLIICDGTGYVFETLKKRKKRKITYSEPLISYNFYKKHGIEVNEYRKTMELKKILDENLK